MKHLAFSKLPVAVAVALTLRGVALFGYVTGNSVYPPPSYYTFQPPPAGGSYVDPVFSTAVTRLTDARATSDLASGGLLTFIAGEYSTMSPFNQDNSRILVIFQSYFALFDGRSGAFIREFPFEINASSEPRWSRSDPALLYYRAGNQLKQYNVNTEAMSVVRVFGEYTAISGKGESDISFDGDHFVLVGDNRYIFVYQLSTGTKGPALDTGGRGFDSVYITPDNNVTVTWLQAGSGRYRGIELYDRNMVFQRQLTRAGGHMDVGRDVNGEEILVWNNSADPLPVCNNGIVKVRLSDGQQTCLLSLDWSLAVHISATDNSGWVLMETYAPSDPNPASSTWVPYVNEIVQIKLDGSQVRRLAHHRSRPFNSYNWMPRASASRDGSRMMYNANYSLQSILGYPSEYSDVYVALLPADTVGTAVGGGGGNTTAGGDDTSGGGATGGDGTTGGGTTGGDSTTDGATSFWTASGSNLFKSDPAGNVGIGTTTPANKLHLFSGISDVLRVESATSASNIIFTTSNGQTGEFTANAGGLQFNSPLSGKDIIFRTQGINPVVFKSGGSVGVGTTAPATKLHVVSGLSDVLKVESTGPTSNIIFATSNGQTGEFTANAGGLQFNSPLPGKDIVFRTQGINPVAFKSGGAVGIGTVTPALGTKLHVAGNVKADGNISGAAIFADNQDVAEWVPALYAIPAGTVVVLDPDRPNGVIPSARPYDPSVAGVVSAAPGILLGEAGRDKVKVATTGRVRVRVDASRGPIRIGDLLVTGDRPGTAMRSEPLDLGGVPIHRPGTLIGKALEPLAGGEGEILVLLSLQ